jgi:antirestriction protein ArdC
MAKQNKVLDAVVNQIIERIEKTGVLPWQRPWRSANQPMNMEYKNAYSGLNRWSCILAGYTSPFWLTFSQISKLGGKIKKGNQHTKIMKVALIEKKRKNAKGEEEVYARWTQPVKYYKMWNLEQTEGIEAPETQAGEVFEPIKACESLVKGFMDSPAVIFGGSKAEYSVKKDEIKIPKKEAFINSEEFYNTLFHEYAHSTGHSSRLNRRTVVENASFGTETYGKEELVAELTASMLCGHCNVVNKVIDNSSAYISGWLNKMRAEPRMLMASAGMAEKAFKHIVEG